MLSAFGLPDGMPTAWSLNRWEPICYRKSFWPEPPSCRRTSRPWPLAGSKVLALLEDEAAEPEGPGDPWHYSEPRRGWLYLLRLASWQARAGVSLPTIGGALGRRNLSTTAIYARLQGDATREGMAAGNPRQCLFFASRVKPGTRELSFRRSAPAGPRARGRSPAGTVPGPRELLSLVSSAV